MNKTNVLFWDHYAPNETVLHVIKWWI